MHHDHIVLEQASYRHHLAEADEARRRGDLIAEAHHRAQALLSAKRMRQGTARPLCAMQVIA